MSNGEIMRRKGQKRMVRAYVGDAAIQQSGSMDGKGSFPVSPMELGVVPVCGLRGFSAPKTFGKREKGIPRGEEAWLLGGDRKGSVTCVGRGGLARAGGMPVP
jgi:hypothetical protein